jgi:hypothetical protein
LDVVADSAEMHSAGSTDVESDRLSSHILPTSATMVGVCMTVVSLLQLRESAHTMSRIDELVAANGLVYLLSAAMSYLAIRNRGGYARRLERLADVTFMVGLCITVTASFLLAYSLL